ncbi:MAG: hypothetical protein ACRC46_00210 [Thermoguttaceae bacterium]
MDKYYPYYRTCTTCCPVGTQFTFGTISEWQSGNCNGLQYEVVRPNNTLIASGTVTQSYQSISGNLGLGAIYRMQTRGNYMGFRHIGPWACIPIWVTQSHSAGCWEIHPVVMQQDHILINTYENTGTQMAVNYIFTTRSALSMPARSTITVKKANNTPLTGIDVYLLTEDMQYRWNTELRATDSTGKVQYTIPNRVRRWDNAVVCIPTEVDTACYLKDVNGYIGVNYGGFWHTQPMPYEKHKGFTTTITLPTESIATIKRLGVVKPGQAVYVANASATSIMSSVPSSTDSTGKVSFSIPSGTPFRYLVTDTDGTQTLSNILTAPANATLSMFANNTPTLISPASNATCNVSTVMNFSWNAVPNAVKYAWFYRHSSAASFEGYLTTGTTFNGIQFGGPGTWYWVVQAFDSSGSVIAQSAMRSFTLTASAPSAVAPIVGGLGISEMSNIVDENRSSSVVRNADATGVILSNKSVKKAKSNIMVASEELAEQIALMEDAANKREEKILSKAQFIQGNGYEQMPIIGTDKGLVPVHTEEVPDGFIEGMTLDIETKLIEANDSASALNYPKSAYQSNKTETKFPYDEEWYSGDEMFNWYDQWFDKNIEE